MRTFDRRAQRVATLGLNTVQGLSTFQPSLALQVPVDFPRSPLAEAQQEEELASKLPAETAKAYGTPR